MALEVQNLHVILGGVHAVNDVTLSVEKGLVMGLIGPNGAGKTSAVNAISGYVKLASGSVSLDGKNVTGWTPQQLLGEGLARTFQGARLFGSLTVKQNLMVAALAHHRKDEAVLIVGEVLEKIDLAEIQDSLAEDQPAGVQRLIGIGRALATKPNYVLLDEPAAGLNETESVKLSELLMTLAKQENLGLLVIEHDMSIITTICNDVHVLDSGETLFTGSANDMKTNPAVIEAYLGSAL